MTDQTPPPVAPTPAAAPVAAGPKQILSLISFIAGIAGVLLSAVPVFGFLVAVAGIVLGFMGRKREPGAPKWMATVGIITGFVGAVLGILFFFLLIILPIIFAASLNSSIYNY
ncbi:MAG: hypothetical protein JWN80_1895 [Microbacteriaceae bacterium]|jgi:hypothetical protein|nr:hypothetical protein [Microbacteriaceae bacterium]